VGRDMGNFPQPREKLGGIVEIDETYIGGKNVNQTSSIKRSQMLDPKIGPKTRS
jgi:hypothetical protein